MARQFMLADLERIAPCTILICSKATDKILQRVDIFENGVFTINKVSEPCYVKIIKDGIVISTGGN